MARVRLDTSRIVDHATFHDECMRVLGFPEFYGRNMDAWIDCLSCLREDTGGMTSVLLGASEVLELEVPDVEALGARAPAVVRDLVECAAFVNQSRYVDLGEPPAITLLFT